MATRQASSSFQSARAAATLWIGMLGGPVAWFLNQQINLVLVPWACASGSLVVLHLVSLACLLAAAGAGGLAWRNWRRSHDLDADDTETTASRARFMAFVGLLSSGFFCLVILAQDLPNFIIDPCQR